MAILVQKFPKLFSKQTHPLPHGPDEELSASLQAFRSQISKFVAQLGFDLGSGSENPSLSWIHRCFGLLPIAHKAFAELVVDIDHPISKWRSDTIEGYLSYTLGLLELFNSVSSSLSRLGQSRLSLSYGLIKFKKSPSVMNHLTAIEIGSGRSSPNFGGEPHRGSEKSRNFHGKERVVQEAIGELKMIGFWVCGILLSALSSDAKAYLELRKVMAGGVYNSLDSKISEKMVVLKEVKEINDGVGDLVVASDDAVKLEAAMELEKKVNGFQKMMDDLSKEIDEVFNKVMSQRNELIDSFRFRKQSQKFIV